MEKFIGSDLDNKECELRMYRVDPMHRENEADLCHSRWFDYAHLHPTQATYLYAQLYKDQTRNFYESYIDIRTAEDARAFVPDDIFLSRDMTSMWLARRACDAQGIPYNFALQFAQKRALNRMFSRFLRPNQLYGEEFMIDLEVEWRSALASTIMYSRMSKFRVANWTASKLQKRHLIFVVGQIKARHVHHNLLGRMFNEGILSPGLVESYFSAETIHEATKVATLLAGQS